jgi:hypothetical protein
MPNNQRFTPYAQRSERSDRRGSVKRTVVRHEALLVRAEVRDLRRLAVVAVG